MDDNDPLTKAIRETFDKLTPEQKEAWQKTTSKYPPDEADLAIVEDSILKPIAEGVERNKKEN